MHNLAHVCRPIHELFNVMKLGKGSAKGGVCTCHIIASEGYGQLSLTEYSCIFSHKFSPFTSSFAENVKLFAKSSCVLERTAIDICNETDTCVLYFQNIIQFHGTRVQGWNCSYARECGLSVRCSPPHNHPVSSTPDIICVLNADENLFTSPSNV